MRYGKENDNSNTSTAYSYIEIDERPQVELLAKEKEMLGFYVSGHPLDEYRDLISKISNITSIDIVAENSVLQEGEMSNRSEEDIVAERSMLQGSGISNRSAETEISFNRPKIYDGQSIKIVGLISNIRTKVTKNGDIMAFISVEDFDGTIEMIVFPKTYSQFRNLLFEEAIVYIQGRINIKDEDEISVVALNFKLIEEVEDLEKIIKEQNNASKYKEENRSGAQSAPNNVSNDKETLLKKALQLAQNKKVLIINIPGGLSEETLSELRSYIRSLKNEKQNTKVRIVNKDIYKDMELFVDGEVIRNLQKRIGEENVKFM